MRMERRGRFLVVAEKVNVVHYREMPARREQLKWPQPQHGRHFGLIGPGSGKSRCAGTRNPHCDFEHRQQ